MADNTFVNDLIRSKSPRAREQQPTGGDELNALWTTLQKRLIAMLDGVEELVSASRALPEDDPASDNLRDAIVDLGDHQDGIVWAVEDLEVILGLDEGDDLLEPEDYDLEEDEE